MVRLHGANGNSLKPVLIICHLDVVEARREDWTTDPFQFIEKDGYFYGRGTQDMKSNDAVLVATLIRFKQEGFVPNRDIILALTAGEESGLSNGVDWLLKNRRDLVDAEFVLNPDGGGVTTERGKPLNVDVEASEKIYADFALTARNKGGHSSLPVPDNAIYHIADALGKLERSPFPFELNNVTRAYFEQMATLEKGQRGEDMRGDSACDARPRGHRAPLSRSAFQLDHAHDLRGHPPQRRPCQQRSSAERRSHRELPHSSRPLARRNSAGPGAAFSPIRKSKSSVPIPRPRKNPCHRLRCAPTYSKPSSVYRMRCGPARP